MKLASLTIGLLALFSPLAAAWSKEDREIFRIRDEIAAHEVDPAATFYDILGITSSASQDDITKAYRAKTRTLHPDKVKQKLKADAAKASKKADGAKSAKGPSQSEIKAAVKQAGDRQARLSLIANILRGSGRVRYDHFLSNGFPLWKGTDYYYNRYRPGLGTAMAGVFIVCGGAVHYLILYMSYKRQKEFVERYVKFARDTAWGGTFGVPSLDTTPPPTPQLGSAEDEDGPQQPMNRRMRRMQEKETKKEGGRPTRKSRKQQLSASASREGSTGPAGAKKRVVAENGKVLVVDSVGDVFLEEADDEGNVNEFLLDPNEIALPSFRDTAVVRLPIWLFHSSVGRYLSKQSPEADAIAGEEDSDSGVGQHTPSTDSAGEDFEMLDKSTDSLGKAKATGTQGGGRANRRKGRKR